MPKPPKTLADYIVVAISPVLIMLLVGSLMFFLIQVFYRGPMVHGIRWVMFWFVLAIVLVSRIGIEQGKGYARFYGVALAVVTWFYLARTHGTVALGALLLAVPWWCAHRLTVDCTFINEDDDASGEGVLQGLRRMLEESLVPTKPPPEPPSLSPLDALVAANLAKRRLRKPPRPPGRTVVWFSLAALPLFGLGQLFLPADDPRARHVGFAFLAIYLGAALSLLATTSFLGLRRYLRQRSTEMPASVAWAWLKFGFSLATGVLLLALVLPRPGANATWRELTYRIVPKPHPASEYALPFNPPGEGEGTPGELPADRELRGSDLRRPSSANGGVNNPRDNRTQPNARGNPDQSARSDGGGGRGGDQGSSGNQGQNGQPGDRTAAQDTKGSTPGRSVDLKDVTGSVGAADSGGSDRPAGSDHSVERIPEGNGDRQVNPEPSQDRPRPADAQRKPPPTEQNQFTRQDRQPEPEPSVNSTPSEQQPRRFLARLLRLLVIVALATLSIWFLVHHRKAIADMIRALIRAVREFFQKLLAIRWRRKPRPSVITSTPLPVLEPFASYENPFVTGKDTTWPPARLLRYTYEAACAWAKEQKVPLRPQETPREFCHRLMEHFPDFGEELEQFSFYYTHAAFADRLPDDFETESIRRLWQYLGDSVPVVASR